MSYVETGKGDPIVFLHGNPTSSYLWRNVIPHLADLGHCLAPDLIGMGDSSKAPMYDYRFVDHAKRLDLWFDAVGATEKVHLVVHDWGSALGFYRALRFPEQIASITYMEAIVQPRPWSGFGPIQPIFRALRTAQGEEMGLGEDVFVETVIPKMVMRKLSEAEMNRYRAPYPTRESRIPTLLWGRQIPLEADAEPADVREIVTNYAAFLRTSPIPKLFIRANPGSILQEGGAEVDSCRLWPNQREVEVPGLHFLQEDSADAIGDATRSFLMSLGNKRSRPMSRTNTAATARSIEKLPGHRHLNGPQTTGRDYRNLSQPEYAMICDQDVVVPMRDGVNLLVDVYRPDAQGPFPSLLAASCYPRQIQNLGAPMGFIEAGASDFWVSRGYVHIIANLRGTSGSEGMFTFFDAQERRDMYDLVEWVAAQPWCDGKVAGIGLSYFASAQIEAAVERPPHLKAIFPLGLSPDFYEAARHHGLFSSSMMSPFLSNVGIMSDQGKNKLWRGKMINLLRHVLALPKIHDRFATFNGESAKAVLQGLRHLNYEAHPWDDIWRAMAVEHPVRDEWWDDRDTESMLAGIDIPVYLGCDWENVPLHLPGTFAALKALGNNPHVRVALLGRYGLTWPWESLHDEALAWFDQWLKGRDTGVLEGPRIRYWLPVAEEWRTADVWPPAESRLIELALRADGRLSQDEGEIGVRSYECLGAGLDRLARASDPPSSLTWETADLEVDVDMAGSIELRLQASATASDTAWIVTLQDVSPDGSVYEVTAGWLQASLREVDEAASELGAPVLPCRRAQAVPIGEKIPYRIPMVANARRFKAGHRIRVLLCSDDQPEEIPAIMNFRHSPVGTSSLNTIHSSSQLLLPVISSATP